MPYDHDFTITTSRLSRKNKKAAISTGKLISSSVPFAAVCIPLYLFHIKGLGHILLALDFFHVYTDQRSLSYRSIDKFHSAFDKVR